MTEEERQRLIAAYEDERRGYRIHGKTDRVELVDAELVRLGATVEKPKRKRRKPSPARGR